MRRKPNYEAFLYSQLRHLLWTHFIASRMQQNSRIPPTQDLLWPDHIQASTLVKSQERDDFNEHSPHTGLNPSAVTRRQRKSTAIRRWDLLSRPPMEGWAHMSTLNIHCWGFRRLWRCAVHLMWRSSLRDASCWGMTRMLESSACVFIRADPRRFPWG